MRTNATIVYEPFETAALPRKLDKNSKKGGRGQLERYDLVFTSPPFFDFEVYTSLKGQSMDTFQQFNDWLVGFLYVSLSRAWSLLDKGGYMAIHITDIPSAGVLVCEKMVLFMMWRLSNCMYLGCVGSSGHVRKPRPIWIVQKLGTKGGSETSQQTRNKEKKRSEMAGEFLKKIYPDVHARIIESHDGTLGDWDAMRKVMNRSNDTIIGNKRKR